MKEREVVSADFGSALDGLTAADYRIALIYPADEPHTAVLERGGDRVRLTSRPGAPVPSESLAPFRPEFVFTQGGGASGTGRAGMGYRDLVPSRLGGRYIASHISVPGGGPVHDWVHFHRIALQIIVVRRGWVRVVYEDQGEPFVMYAGDLILQPPGIRHRVIESGDDLEVIEIGAPALHATFADHEMSLPNGVDNSRLFDGQQFLRHIAAETPWRPFGGGGEAQETGMAAATGGLADVRLIRSAGADAIAFERHSGELLFGFVISGSATLNSNGVRTIVADDAFVIPPLEPWAITGPSPDFALLHVTTKQLD